MRSDLIAALDVGSTKIACLIAEIDSNAKLKVIGIGHQVSQGIRGGIVIDIKQAEGSIVSAVHAAEKMAGETIDRVLINVSGGNLNSRHVNVQTAIGGLQVTDRDIHQITLEGMRHFVKEESEILHTIPVEYRIDDTSGITDPRGMTGENLNTNLHVIAASSTAVKNLANCLARCHLDIEDCVAGPYATGLACLTEDEKNLGTILLDIGGGNTSISVFANGTIIYTNNVALGGQHITRDIARGLSTSINVAERIKTLHGTAAPTEADRQHILDVPMHDPELEMSGNEDEGEMMHISKAELGSIIRPRAEEIIELVKKKLEASDFNEFAGSRVVLTGGSAQLAGMRELTQELFGRQPRIAKPLPMDGLAESTKGPAFSGAVGMLRYALVRQGVMDTAPKLGSKLLSQSFLGKLSRWFQEDF